MHLKGVGQSGLMNRIVLGRDPAITSSELRTDQIGGPDSMDLNRPGMRLFVSRSTGSILVSGARRLPQPAAGPANGGGSEVLSSYRPAALPKPFVPSGCASIGIIAAPLSELFFVKRWS